MHTLWYSNLKVGDFIYKKAQDLGCNKIALGHHFDDVIETIIEQNPSEPEFHQAVREVLESLRVVIEENEEEFIIGLDSDEEFDTILNLFTQKYTN